MENLKHFNIFENFPKILWKIFEKFFEKIFDKLLKIFGEMFKN